MKSFEKVFVSLFVFFFLGEIESAREGGIRNFKFRKKEPSLSSSSPSPSSTFQRISNSKSMDLRRYHDESGNLLAFGYRLPEKSYAIFRLPPPAHSARPPQHRRQDPYTKVLNSNNFNRARKVVASSVQNIKSRRFPQNFRRDKKEISFDNNKEVVSAKENITIANDSEKEAKSSNVKSIKFFNDFTPTRLTPETDYRILPTTTPTTAVVSTNATTVAASTNTTTLITTTTALTYTTSTATTAATTLETIANNFWANQEAEDTLSTTPPTDEGFDFYNSNDNDTITDSSQDTPLFNYSSDALEMKTTNEPASFKEIDKAAILEPTKVSEIWTFPSKLTTTVLPHLYSTKQQQEEQQKQPQQLQKEQLKEQQHQQHQQQQEQKQQHDEKEQQQQQQVQQLQQHTVLTHIYSTKQQKEEQQKQHQQQQQLQKEQLKEQQHQQNQQQQEQKQQHDEKEQQQRQQVQQLQQQQLQQLQELQEEKNQQLEEEEYSSNESSFEPFPTEHSDSENDFEFEDENEDEEFTLLFEHQLHLPSEQHQQQQKQKQDEINSSFSELSGISVSRHEKLEQTSFTSNSDNEDRKFNDSISHLLVIQEDLLDKPIIPQALIQRQRSVEKTSYHDDVTAKCRSSNNLDVLQNVFPNCRRYLSRSDCQQTSDLSHFGFCLLKTYPETRVLSLSQTLTSGGGTVKFESDDECTDFVHLFFPNCSQHIPSCGKVQHDQKQAVLVLGCLFSHYTELMIPLLSIGKEP